MRSTMTKRFLPVLLAIVPVTFTACDIPIDFWDAKTITVDLAAGGETSVSNTQTVNLNNDSAISKNLSKLTSLKVPEVWLKMDTIYPDNAATTVSGTVTISDPTDSSWTPVTLTYNNVPITADSELDISPDPSVLVDVASLLKNKHELQAVYSASVDQLPAHFSFDGRIHISATVPFAP
jgi:hypothetical protein